MKECELCNFPARMYCESDQASLCWDCDAKVHSANFLVARHSRNLLCQVCQSPTPWKAFGAKLGPTVSVCQRCVSSCNQRQERAENEEEKENEDDDDDEEGEEEEDDEDEEDEMGGEEEEEDGDNQVVPWSSSTPPPLASSSSSEESSSGKAMAVSLKRMRENADVGSQHDLGCSSSQRDYTAGAQPATSADDEATSTFSSFRQSNPRHNSPSIRPSIRSAPPVANGSRSTTSNSIKRLQLDRKLFGDKDVSAPIVDVCKLSKDPRTVDLVSKGNRHPPI